MQSGWQPSDREARPFGIGENAQVQIFEKKVPNLFSMLDENPGGSSW